MRQRWYLCSTHTQHMKGTSIPTFVLNALEESWHNVGWLVCVGGGGGEGGLKMNLKYFDLFVAWKTPSLSYYDYKV